MDDAVGIGVLGAGWITRAHGHALHTPRPRRPACQAYPSDRAEGRRVRIDEMTVAPEPTATA